MYNNYDEEQQTDTKSYISFIIICFCLLIPAMFLYLFLFDTMLLKTNLSASSSALLQTSILTTGLSEMMTHS